MSLYGAFDKTQHFRELRNHLSTARGILTPGQRQALCRLELGLNGGFGPVGRDWYVDGNQGSASGSGYNWEEARLTVASVFTDSDFRSGDRIFIKGNIREELTAPAGIFDVAIIGAGYKPRHADAHTSAGGYNGMATWRDPASGATAVPHLILQQQGWLVYNIMFAMGGTNTAGVQCFANTDSGDAERDASHSMIIGCHFRGSGIGVQAHGLPNDLVIEGNTFDNLTTCISSTVGAGAKTLRYARIRGNYFADSTNGIVGGFNRADISGNRFMATMTKEIDLTGGEGNVVTQNVFMNNYDANVASGATDMWYNNVSLDTTSGEVSDELAASPSGYTYTRPVA